MRGVLLWLRHHHVPQCVVVAVIGTLVCGFLTSSDAFIADVAPLWCAALATIPMLFVVIGEDDMDRTSSRSLSARRGVLVAVGGCGHHLPGRGLLPRWGRIRHGDHAA